MRVRFPPLAPVVPMRKQLILITGVGNYDRLFEFFAFVWQFFGFEAHVGAFGWYDRPELFEKKMQKLLDDIDSLSGKPVYIIGASAGGTAAIHALAARPKAITKVATLCSPLMTMSSLRNPLLEKSIAQLPKSFASFDDATRKKVLSVYTQSDNIVDYQLSKPAGIRTYRLLTHGHGFTVFTGLTIFSFPIRKFFRGRISPLI
jgi:pimeloyl-ACP methyl ester carboxylesterase